MSRLWCLIVTALVIVGCDDGPAEDPCADIESPCELDGDRRCHDGDVERCELRFDGCLEWTESAACGVRQECRDAECLCQDGCDTEGDRRCEDGVVYECVADGDGCLFWEGQLNCSGAGQSCGELDGEITCIGCANDRCDELGLRSCRRQTIQVCERQDDGCLDWEIVEDCAELEPAHFCSDDGTEVACVEECVDNCDEAGTTRCSGLFVEACVYQEYGCLDWEEFSDCAASDSDWCDDSGDEARCVACDHRCPAVDDVRCADSVVSTCQADTHGCRDWEAGLDCSTLDPVQLCQEEAGSASCVELPATGACDAPIVVSEPHYVLSGLDFTADFEDDHLLAGEGCVNHELTVDAVFAVDLNAGQTLQVRELGDLDAVLSVQQICGDGGACPISEDTFEERGQSYTAAVDERIYVIIEAWSAEPRTVNYEIRLDVVEPEVCDSTVDEDADGAAGCDDSDCWGAPPCDEAERNCSDEGDNDGDGATDCADDDCASAPICGDYQAVYEEFTHLDTIDLVGHSVTFAPAPAAAAGYEFSSNVATEFPLTPSSGTASTTVLLDDDDVATHLLTLTPSITFYGEEYGSIYVNSNGYVTFGDWDVDSFLSLDDFYAHPTVAGLLTDLSPDRPSTSGDAVVTIDELVDRVAVTFESVPSWYSEMGGFVEGPNDFQMVIHGSGEVEITWLEINAVDAVVGVTSGVGTGDFPASVDLVP